MRCLILISVVLSIAMNTLFAETWVVDTTGAEGDSLQKAINSAWADPGIDTVLVKDGTYHLEGINGDTGLIMRDSTVLMSENGAQKCTLTAISHTGTDTAWHVIYCSGWDTASHAALIKGFTIKDGNATGSSPHNCGGGIHIYSASPTIDSCVITNNYADDRGGGIYICWYSSPTLSGNTITNNSANYGGGICIYDHPSPTLEGNTITNNSANYGGGILIWRYSSPTLKGNTITNNSAEWWGGGISIWWYSSPKLEGNTITNNSANYGGGISIWYYSSPTLEGNTITNNSANNRGGGISIWSNSSPTLKGNIITNNSAECWGGGICIWMHSSAELTKCVLGMNKSKYGGAIYDTLHSKVIIDSSFIVDNGDYLGGAGLAYITADADSGLTFNLTYSHIYYNTFQPDTEINNLSNVTINLENNFWWDTTDTEISAKISGLNDHTPWSNDFISGVPGEPLSVDSLRNYNKDFTQVVDSLGEKDTLYIRVYGQDRNAHIREIAVVIIKSSIYPQGIAVGLVETDTNSGVYEGKAYVFESTGNDTIRVDDINQIIRVDSTGDSITLISNIDTTKKFYIKYKGGAPTGVREILPNVFAVSPNCPNPFINFTIIKYQLPQKECVTIKILDITGRVVNTLVDEVKEPGYYSVIWHGKDTNGKSLPAGIYFCIIKAGKHRALRKMIRLKYKLGSTHLTSCMHQVTDRMIAGNCKMKIAKCKSQTWQRAVLHFSICNLHSTLSDCA